MKSEKEWRKLVNEARCEWEKVQKEYNRTHYSKQITAISETLAKSDEVLDLIQSEELTRDDCLLLAGCMAKRIRGIYRNFEDLIDKNKARRRNKNKLRNERRNNTAPANSAEEPVTAETTAPADTTRRY